MSVPQAFSPRIAVIGAGPVGLALALHASRVLPTAALTVLDARDAARDISDDPRTLALALGSVQLLKRLRAWPARDAQAIGEVHVSQQPPTLPWGRSDVRIRAIDARTTTPLGIALRGRFLVGSKPVSTDIVRRFVACAAENGIDVFRLHDPLNDVSNLREAGEAIVGAGRQLHVGLVYSPGRTGEADGLVEQAKRLGDLGAARVLLNDPTGALLPHVTQELVERLAEASGLPVGLYVQAAGGTALANALVATRVGADVVATAVYPLGLALHRIAGESLVEALVCLHADGEEREKAVRVVVLLAGLGVQPAGRLARALKRRPPPGVRQQHAK